MKNHLCLLASLLALGAAACSSDPNVLDRPNGGPGEPGSETPTPENPDPTPAALQCTQVPEGRSYVLFDGSKMEASRINENVGVNRARIKPFGVLAGEYQRALGLVPASLAAAGSSFDEPPARWYAEAQHSGVSLNAIFDLSFEGCLAFTKTSADYATAPTTATATTVCTALMRKAWSHSPSPEEIASCTTLAVTKLAAEPDARKRWTYVCSSILSSSQFLTF